METKSVYFSEYVYGVLIGLGLNEEDAHRGVRKIMGHFEDHAVGSLHELKRNEPEIAFHASHLMKYLLDTGEF